MLANISISYLVDLLLATAAHLNEALRHVVAPCFMCDTFLFLCVFLCEFLCEITFAMFAVCLQFTIKKEAVTSVKCKRAGLDLGKQHPW